MIARANHRVTYPARIQLVAAMNPCRCGMAGEPGYRCLRGERCRTDYQARISGPLLDRIDLRIEVPAVSASDLIRPDRAEPSAAVALRVARARAIQRERFERLGVTAPPPMRIARRAVIEEIAAPDAAGLSLLQRRQRKARLFGARLSPRAEGGAHAGRSRRQRDGRPHPSRRGDFLSHERGSAWRRRRKREVMQEMQPIRWDGPKPDRLAGAAPARARCWAGRWWRSRRAHPRRSGHARASGLFSRRSSSPRGTSTKMEKSNSGASRDHGSSSSSR